jgi:hypothetical protein
LRRGLIDQKEAKRYATYLDEFAHSLFLHAGADVKHVFEVRQQRDARVDFVDPLIQVLFVLL